MDHDFIINVNTFTSEKLADVIVTFRYLGCFKEEAIVSMKELARRRSLGDTFDFESYISTESAKLPKITINNIKIK